MYIVKKLQKNLIMIYVVRLMMIILSFCCLNWGTSLQQIKNTAKNIQSIQSSFIQKKYMRILKKPLISRGVFFFKSPASLRWEYKSPVSSILLMHKGSIKRYTKRGNQVIEDSGAQLQSMRIVLDEIVDWLKGNFTDNPNFKTVLKPGRKIVLTPREKSMAKIIMKIELRLATRPGIIESVCIYESNNSYTLLQFNKQKLNLQLNDLIFRNL